MLATALAFLCGAALPTAADCNPPGASGVLERIRAEYPAMRKIEPRPAARGIIIALEPQLFESLRLEDPGGEVAVHTASADFDALTASLEVRSTKLHPLSTMLVLDLSPCVDVVRWSARYARIDGVRYAEPNAYTLDGPDIAMSERDGVWHAVFREAWGDCPSGCIHEKLHFFLVNGAEVEKLDPEPFERRRPPWRLLADCVRARGPASECGAVSLR